jgi:hypothetical protein
MKFSRLGALFAEKNIAQIILAQLVPKNRPKFAFKSPGF